MDNRGIDQDPGWINRKFQDLSRQIEALRSERRAAATEIASGVLEVSGTGSIHVLNDGDIVISDGGDLASFWGTTLNKAISIGSIIEFGAPEKKVGRQILLQSADSNDVFRAYEYAGATIVKVGDGLFQEAPVDEFVVVSTAATIQSDSLTITGRGIGGTTALKIITAATTSSSANLTVDAATGSIARSTSSRRYKQDIADHDIDPLSVLKMRVRTWRDRSEVEEDADTTQRYIGFIAEELHDLGLTEFVSYDEQGRPDAVAYDRIPAALLIALRWLTKQVSNERTRTDALTSQVTAQQKQIDELAAKVAALTPPTAPTTGSI